MRSTLNWQRDGRLRKVKAAISEEGLEELSPQQQYPVQPRASLMVSWEGDQMLGWTVARAQGVPTASQYTYHLGASCSRLRLNEGGQVMVALHNHSHPPHARKRLLSLYNQGTHLSPPWSRGPFPTPTQMKRFFLYLGTSSSPGLLPS